MVQDNADEHGIHVTDIDKYEQLQPRIARAIDTFNASFDIDDILVFGSYGNGDGVPGQSDLDVLVVGTFNGVLNDTERSRTQSALATHIETASIGDDIPEITALDVGVVDTACAEHILRMYSAFASVTEYYSLTTDEPRYYNEVTP